MSKLDPKQQDIVKLANKKGSDADLFLLDKVHEVDDKLESLKANQPDLNKVLESVRGTPGKDSVIPGPKGDAGEKGDQGESIEGPSGRDGVDGKDGKDGRDGKDGIDGEDGADGKDADTTALLAQISALKDELDSRFAEFESKAPSRQPVVYGPGKTKLIVLDLSSQLDGSTTTFQLGTNFGIVNVSSSSAPFGAFRPIIDYNAVGKTIVFTANVDAPSALAAGQSLIVTYLR